jgi:hypothetical protein
MVNLGMEYGQESVDWNISFIDWRKNEDEEGVPIWLKTISYSSLALDTGIVMSTCHLATCEMGKDTERNQILR